MTGIPAYRLPRGTISKEIESLLDENVELKCGTKLGKDISLDRLFNEGYKAVFLAMGAHKSRLLNIEGEDLAGVHPALRFLKAFNLRGEMLAKGRVGVIGGGDSAVDAARVALRQPGVESVTIFYRRAKQEMPALPEEVDEALHEGIALEAMVSPMRILSEGGKLVGAEFIRNAEGDVDAGGRRKPVPVKGSEFVADVDTLIVTIGDTPDIEFIEGMGVAITKGGSLHINPDTLETSRPGVFAGGDVVTGPNTVVEAIAAGKKAAVMIARYLRGESLAQPASPRLPGHYIEPLVLDEAALAVSGRAKPPSIPPENRRGSFDEVELALDVKDAMFEARRCLRCDLDFTKKLAECAACEVKEA
jgi:NADH-quinone oxidoreductase subunit F